MDSSFEKRTLISSVPLCLSENLVRINNLFLFRITVVEGMKQIAKNDNNAYLIPQSSDEESVDFYEQNPPPIGHYTAKSMKRIGIEFFKIYEAILDKK